MSLKEKGDDSYLQYFFSISYFQTFDVMVASVLHIKEKEDELYPALADKRVLGGKPMYSTSKITTLRKLADEIDAFQPPGFRYVVFPPSPFLRFWLIVRGE